MSPLALRTTPDLYDRDSKGTEERLLASPAAGDTSESARRTVSRAMYIGLWVWPTFTLLDVYMCFVAFPGAPFGLFMVYRVAIELLFYAVYRASLRPDAELRKLYWYLNLAYGFAALGIALMAVHLGGIRSPYMHGISVVALVRAALVPAHWRRSLNTYARIGTAFPLVMGLGALLSPTARAEWLNRESLIVFGSNYVFVLASSVLGLITGHAVWAAQEQLYRARRVGRYRLQAPIGKGGMGEVWLAWDLTLRRNVALKILRSADTPSPEAVKRFEREAHAAGQLHGPHIVQIFDFGASEDGLYYIAMEYLTGMNLATLVERFGPMPSARAIRVAMQVCTALEDAHNAGIIHRDLKPQNLFMTRVGDDSDFVKLLDFGIVRLRAPGPESANLTWTGTMIGTPAYLAPEVWSGTPADERSDIYSLGVTLHYLLSGATPFDGLTVAQMRSAQLAGVHPALLLPTMLPSDEALKALVLRCLAWNPDDRMPSARQLHEELAALAASDATWTMEDAEAFWREAERGRGLAVGSEPMGRGLSALRLPDVSRLEPDDSIQTAEP
jgi:serine/threonine-protein kinase